MSIGNAVTPLGLGHHNRASLLNSTPRIDESPRGRHLRGRWRLHNHLQGEFLHDQESSNSIKSRSSDHQQFLALTSTPRHSWLRSRLSRCSVSPILLEDDEEGNKDLEAICCANAHDIDARQAPEIERFSTTLFAANLEKMELDDKDGANNNLKGNTESIKREECTSSSKENIKVPNKKTKKKVRPKKSPNESLHRKKDGRKISVGASKKLKSPKDPHLRILKKRSLNADVVSSTCSSKRKSNERSKSDAESSSSVTWKLPKSPLLRTAERAKAKRYRQELRKQKEKQIEEMRQKILEEQRRKEEEEFQKLRQQTVFKAAPIRKYAPLPQVKKRALTEPVSPNIRKRRRTGSSSRCCSSNQTE